MSSSNPYTLENFLLDARVPRPAPFAKYLEMAFTPRADQVVGLNRTLINTRFGLFDDPGCVSAETEFLHPTGWKRIDQWDGEQVAQFDPEADVVSFVSPLRYVKEPCREMLHLKAGRGVDQVLSADHRVLTYSNTNAKRDGGRGPWKVETAQDLFDNQHKNTGRKIRTAFQLDNRPPANIREGDLRLMVAVIADGYLPNRNNTAYLRLKKERKVNRLRYLLDSLGHQYTEKPCKPDGFTMFSFTTPRHEKHFTSWWWGLSPQQLAVVVDEAAHWDGSVDARGNGGYSFFTRVEASADFMQFAASAVGRTANKYVQARDGGIDYIVRVTSGTAFVSGKPNKPWITRVPNPEGYKYCFQVPTGFLVLRHNGKVFLTGNCGKTVQMQAQAMQMIAEGNKVMMLMPPVLLGQFVESLCETFTEPYRYFNWHVLNQGPAPREVLFERWEREGWPELLLMSYEMFVLLTRVPKGQRGRPKVAHPLRENYRVVTCDEGHKLCGHDTHLHNSLSWHCGEVDESMLTIATGTPMPTTPLNAYGLIELLNPGAYSNYNQFERLHAIYKKIRLKEPRMYGKKKVEWISKLDGFRGQEHIRKHLYLYGRRVIKEQVLSLKEPTIREVPVVLGDDHLRLYKRLEKERILEFQGQIIAGGINDQRLRQALLRIVTNPEAFVAPGKKIYNAVLETVLNLVESHGNGMPLVEDPSFPNKVILFCNLRATAAWLQKVMAEFNPIVLNGDTPDKDRARKAFNDDPDCRMLIANPESAGFGLNFQKVSRLAIFVEPTAIPGEFKQAMERIYRQGQEGVAEVYILRASGTIAPLATKEMLNRVEEINRVNRDSVVLSTYFKRTA